MPALTELASPGAKSGLRDELHIEPAQRLLDQFSLVAGDDDDAPGFRGQRLLGHDPDQRLAAEFGQQLVGTAHPGRAAGGENDRGHMAVAVGAETGARLRPRHDFHQQPADAHAGEFGAGDLQPGQQAHQHPVEAVLDRRARAAGRAQHRHAAGIADQEQVAGIDRHAEMLDGAADARDRRRDHVAPVGDRGGAEHDHELRAETEQFLDRSLERRLVMRHAALGHDGGAGRRQPLRRYPQGLFHHLRRQPRQQGRDRRRRA